MRIWNNTPIPLAGIQEGSGRVWAGAPAINRKVSLDELKEGEVSEVHEQPSSSNKRPWAFTRDDTQPLRLKMEKLGDSASEKASSSRDRYIRKNEGRRRRENEYLVDNGRCALPRVRNKMSTTAAVEGFQFNMQGRLVEGTQLGGYRPRVAKMEKVMEELTERMLSACLKGVVCPAASVMRDLKQMGYRELSWDGQFKGQFVVECF